MRRLFRTSLQRCSQDVSSTIYGDGEQSRDSTYVDNIVEANMLAMRTEGVGGGLYNVATGERTSLIVSLKNSGRRPAGTSCPSMRPREREMSDTLRQTFIEPKASLDIAQSSPALKGSHGHLRSTPKERVRRLVDRGTVGARTGSIAPFQRRPLVPMGESPRYCGLCRLAAGDGGSVAGG